MGEFMILRFKNLSEGRMYCGYDASIRFRTVMCETIDEAKNLLKQGKFNEVAGKFNLLEQTHTWEIIESGGYIKPEPELEVDPNKLADPQSLRFNSQDVTIIYDYGQNGEVQMSIRDYENGYYRDLYIEADEVKNLAVFMAYAAALGEQEKANG